MALRRVAWPAGAGTAGSARAELDPPSGAAGRSSAAACLGYAHDVRERDAHQRSGDRPGAARREYRDPSEFDRIAFAMRWTASGRSG